MSDEENEIVSSDGSASDSENEDDNGEFEEQKSNKLREPLIDNNALEDHLLCNQPHYDASRALRMTKYEYTRIKGERLQQLASGSIPFVSYTHEDNGSHQNEKLFRQEFLSGQLPLLVVRKMPNGEFVYIKVKEFTNRDNPEFD